MSKIIKQLLLSLACFCFLYYKTIQHYFHYLSIGCHSNSRRSLSRKKLLKFSSYDAIPCSRKRDSSSSTGRQLSSSNSNNKRQYEYEYIDPSPKEILKALNENLINIITTIHSKEKVALMYTPYDFSAGGGEKYFLEALSYYQKKTYSYVTILTKPYNICNGNACVAKTADALNIRNYDKDFGYYKVKDEIMDIIIQFPVDHFYIMGNEKFPQFKNPGKFGVFQCQFPFDGIKPGSQQQVEMLSTFHMVIVNSEYTRMNFLQCLSGVLLHYQSLEMPYPTVEVLNPPVSIIDDDNLRNDKNFNITNDNNEKIRIVMLGRIFEGRQSKGHRSAIKAMKQLSTITDKFELHIVGQIQFAHENYAERLKNFSIGYPIHYHFSVPRQEVVETLQKSHIFWHLTGIEAQGDAASYEHFGISPVEACSVGLIPIHFKEGAVGEATGDCGKSFLTINELVNHTVSFLNISKDEYHTMRERCISASKQFTVEKFLFRLDRLIVRGDMNTHFYHKLDTFPHVQDKLITNYDKKPKHSAYVYVHTPQPQLPKIVRNIMGVLGPDWQLVVGIRTEMIQYIVPSLYFVPNVIIFEHKNLRGSVTAYSLLLMSVEFWNFFTTEYVLIFQTDTVFFKRNIEYFVNMQYPLLGAPWCSDNEVLIDNIVTWKVGNGGLSLRRKSWMIKCINSSDVWDKYTLLKTKHSNSTPLSSDNEDIFYNICVEIFYTREELIQIEQAASEFAVEVPCYKDFPELNPMGGHAFWYYTAGNIPFFMDS